MHFESAINPTELQITETIRSETEKLPVSKILQKRQLMVWTRCPIGGPQTTKESYAVVFVQWPW